MPTRIHRPLSVGPPLLRTEPVYYPRPYGHAPNRSYNGTFYGFTPTHSYYATPDRRSLLPFPHPAIPKGASCDIVGRRRGEHPPLRQRCSPGVYKCVGDLDATARAATYLNGRLVALLKATIFRDDKFGWCGKDGHV
jgi:hypothetical protein